ncbi:hypothetical protein SAY86_017416 [Trapa natans]|uniref:CMP/dCMP-type deaminase domain-containing protein n=1 Tax=Trapa natans TaxID=22666 RepID=A0AAN7R529_TRANT|nr:hypothetical protein SAY86_017416 [Trapa natans]
MYCSTIMSLRARGSHSFPFTDHPPFSSADRFDRPGLHFSSSLSASCHCSCCCCCHYVYCGYSSASVNRLSVSPNTFLLGPRQSSLLQWSASKRMIFAGGDRGCYWVPGYGIGRDTYESSWISKKKSGEYGSRGRRKKDVKCMVSEGNRNVQRLSRFDDAEALISLLSEEVCEESFGGRVRERTSSANRVEIESKRVYASGFSKGRKKNVRSDLRERDSKHKLELTEIESKVECQSCRRKRENETRQENAKVRKGESSCSSYYSISSLGDFESVHDEVKDDKFEGNLPRASNEDSLVKEQSRIRKDGLEEWERNQRVREEEEVKWQKESTLRGNSEWDWRKKSEKKLDGVSVQETQSTEEPPLHSKIMKSKVQESEKVSTSRSKLNAVDEKLDISINLDSRGSSYGHIENQAVNLLELRNKTEKSSDVCGVCGSELALTSNAKELLNMMNENVAFSADFVGEVRDDTNKPMKRHTEQTSAGVKIQEIDSETVSKLQESDTQASHRKESKSFTSTSAQEREQQKKLQINEKISRQSDKRISQQFNEFSKSHQNVERAYSSCREHQEENINLVSSSVSNRREQYSQISHEEAYHSKNSREEVKDVAAKSLCQANLIETASNSQRAPEGTTDDRRGNINVVVNVGDAVSKTRGESSLKVAETGSRVEPRRLTKIRSFPSNNARLVDDQAKDRGGKDEGSSKMILSPPLPQVAVKGSAYNEQVSRMDARENNISGARTPELKTKVESGDEIEDILGMPVNQLVHEDAVDSAQRSDQLSYQVVGEFIEKARKELLSSEIQSRTSETVLTNQTQISSTQFDSGVQVKGDGSWNSSEDSETKGPSDEIWLETTTFSEEPPNAEAEPTEGSLGSGQAIVKRSGRSLWNIIADIVQLRWSSRTPHSAFELKKKGSSGESVSSEALFSYREQGSTPLEAITPLQRNQSTSALTRSQSSDKRRLLEDHGSSSPNFGSGSALNITSSAYIQKDSDLCNDIKQLDSDKTPLPVESVGLSSSSPIVEVTASVGIVDLPLGGSMEGFQPHGAKLVTVSGMEAKDVQFKQRKLQRNRQVPKDRFDEWEEAYKLQSEQHKIDEMFMREALVEAKKAADNWEVPVGAVLVQHGKIVARGCNLVEELRDATAHAEMICIKEASNVLRSWRLADSTLYVTLEPCAMCAGAILQARIDTLVWGAPNKLLGADGSWIRRRT